MDPDRGRGDPSRPLIQSPCRDVSSPALTRSSAMAESTSDPLNEQPVDAAVAYEAHADYVWRCLCRLGVAQADLPDLLQEVFLVLHRRRDELDWSRPLPPLLWSIARGLAANYGRRHFRRAERPLLNLEAHPSSAVAPEAHAIRRRQMRAAEDALAALPVEKRAVFVMFEVEGMSGKAIAEELGLALGTVHSRLHAARRQLAAALAPAPAAEGEVLR